MLAPMGFMLGRRQTNWDNDDDDDDGNWGYSTVNIELSHLDVESLANIGADRSCHQMGCRWRYPHTARTMACLGTHARSTKDEARSASDVIPQSMSI